jgi:hypothetical protein
MKASARSSASVREFIARRLVRYASTGLKRGGERAAQGQRASGIEQVMGNGHDPETSLHFVKH